MKMDFLTASEVIGLHHEELGRFGGAPGVRDLGLLESAVAQPQASFGGEYLHKSIYEMAAAYLFHIVSNHPFVDGNKRSGLLAALTFLNVNGIVVERGSQQLYDITIAVAEGRASKANVALLLAELGQESPPA